MKKFLTIIILFTLILNQKIFAQGCVAIRSNGGICTMEHPDNGENAKSWQLNTGYRYFKSFRHFRGDVEQKERLVAKTEVINWANSLDFTLLRQFNNRWSAGVGIPLVYFDRSSLYEHGRKERRMSSAYGLSDIRLTAYRWMLNPAKAKKGNFQIGLGVKLPTGNYNFKDEFYNVGPNGTPELRPVDQSIQPGDGGLGIISEVNGYLNIYKGFNAYTNLYYLSNPRATNGTRTYREKLSATLINEAIMSVPDQYMARLGFNYVFDGALKNLSVLAGGRVEGIPVYDLIGESNGFRRPGYVIAVEPGLNYFYKKLNFFATVPIAAYRNRTQSVTDKENSTIQNKVVNGDAAFADYSINAGFSIKF